MCNRSRPRFMTWFHRMVLNDLKNVMLDDWMEATVPECYRVIGVMMDKIVDTAEGTVTFVYTVVGELKDDHHEHDTTVEVAPMMMEAHG